MHSVPSVEVRLYQARTRDRWTIALHRYRLPSLVPLRRLPVILCHGLGSNRHSFDAPRGPSLARFLAARGYDVWSLELRGAGHSSRPHVFNRLRWEWTFRHHATLDAPAAIETVCDATGAPAVHWVGHSLGGMVAYALLADSDAPIHSATAVASPTLHVCPPPELPGAHLVQQVLARVSRVPAGLTARIGAPLTGFAYRLSLFHILYNPDNMDPGAMRRLLRCALDDVPSRLLLEYLSAYRGDGNGKVSDAFSYEERLHRIRAPLLLLGGIADGLCAPRNLQAVYDRVSSEVKRIAILGRHTGCRHDYAHHDLILGKHAADEVFSRIAAWLDERDGCLTSPRGRT